MDFLTPTLRTDEKKPLYQQLYDYIRIEIQEGRLSYKEKLPSKRKLSSYLKISQNTVQSAYNQLIEEGYISSLEKKGYYVNQIDNLQKLRLQQAARHPASSELPNPILYDFSCHGVDIPSFPFDIWRRLTKDAIMNTIKNY